MLLLCKEVIDQLHIPLANFPEWAMCHTIKRNPSDLIDIVEERPDDKVLSDVFRAVD